MSTVSGWCNGPAGVRPDHERCRAAICTCPCHTKENTPMTEPSPGALVASGIPADDLAQLSDLTFAYGEDELPPFEVGQVLPLYADEAMAEPVMHLRVAAMRDEGGERIYTFEPTEAAR